MAYGVHYIGVRLPLLFELVSPQEAEVRGSTPFTALDLTSALIVGETCRIQDRIWVPNMIFGAQFVESKIVPRTPGPLCIRLAIIAMPRLHGRTTACKPHPLQTLRLRPMAARLAIAPLGLSRP